MSKETDILDEFDFDEPEEVVVEAPKPKKRTVRETLKEVSEPIVIQSIDPAIAKRKRDAEKIREADLAWNQRLAGERKIPFKAPKYYKELLSPYYSFTYNGTPVLVRFDGSTQFYPETIYNVVMEKLADILDSHISQNEVDEL